MPVPIEITFRGMARSPALETTAQRWLTRLEHSHARIHNCQITIGLPHRHRVRGATFQVKLVLAVPGGEVVVAQDQDHADAYAALAEAFGAARRVLRDRAQIRRGGIRRHAA